MCIPAAALGSSAAGAVAINTALTSGAISAYSLIQQQQNLQAAADAANVSRKFNRAAAVEDAHEAYGQLAERELQERERTEASISDIESQATRAASLALASAGESGVAGRAVALTVSDFKRQELQAVGRAERGLVFTERAIASEGRAVERQTAARLASNTPVTAPRPDYLGTALRIGGDAFSGYVAAGGRFGAN
jgi:hypothetical protein